MKTLWAGLICVLSSWLLPGAANPLLKFSEMSPQQPLGHYAVLLRDADNQRPFHEILSPAVQAHFQPSLQDNISLGFTSDVIWLRITLYNDLPRAVERLLEIPYPVLDFVTLYESDQADYHPQETGDHFAFSTRDINYRNFLFNLQFPPRQQKTFYLRVKTDSSMSIPLILWETNAFMDHRNESNIGLAFYVSLLIAMLLYNGLLYFAVRDAAYLYYVLFLANWLLFVLGLQGVSFQLFWPNNIWWANQSLPLFICLATLSMVFFSRNFLYADDPMSSQHRWLFKGLLLVSLLGATLSLFLNYTLSIKLATALACIGSLICAVIGVKRWQAGWQAAQYYVIAWTLLFIGIISFGLKAAGVLPDNDFTRWSLHIGAALQVMLFSLALANRINLARHSELQAHQEKYRAQQIAMENMQNAKEVALQASETKTIFLVNMSHQFKTPLNHILGYSQMLDDELALEGLGHLRQDLHKITEAGHYLNHFVTEVLELARIDNHMSYLRLEQFELVELVTQAVHHQQQHYASRHHSVEIKPCQPSISLVSDPFKLRSLLGHLLDNAFKFTPQGSIIVSITQDPVRSGWLCVMVEDSGCGIEDSRMPLVTMVLTQSSQLSLLTAQGQVGLGLLISKRLSELLGGFIAISSEVGRGTLVTLRLPNGQDVITDRM